jgi:hypothetical protein
VSTVVPNTLTRRVAYLTGIACLFALILATAADGATPRPVWKLSLVPGPTNFGREASTGPTQYVLTLTNVGAAASDGSPITITDSLPAGVTVSPEGPSGRDFNFSPLECEVGPPVTCRDPAVVVTPGYSIGVVIPVEVSGSAPSLVLDQASASGGGASSTTASVTTTVSDNAVPFSFQSLESTISDEEGAPVGQAGAHPYSTRFRFALGNIYNSDIGDRPGSGDPKNVVTELPAGLIINPAATAVECTESQLESDASGGGCPPASQVGTILTNLGIQTGLEQFVSTAPLYNMVPPPGSAANLGFDASGAGIYVHLLGAIRTGGDYGITSTTTDILQKGAVSIAEVNLWGNPTDPSHDTQRGSCASEPVVGCPTSVERRNVPLVTLPSDCTGAHPSVGWRVNSWQDPGTFLEPASTFTGIEGEPVTITGCNKLAFSPSLEAKGTTDVADAPAGFNVDVHFPQRGLDETQGLAEADLKKAVVTLPKGIAVNPASANGLTACSEAQIGYEGANPELNTGEYTPGPAECPDASKIGTVEVDSPLLKEHDEAGEPTFDHPLKGAVYVARPTENPFGSLLAIYIAVDDPTTGVIIKLAGEVQADPLTGQLTTTVESPQQPFDDFHLNFFNGAQAALRTPQVCGRYETTSDLTRWSNPEGADAHPADSFQITQAPGGGACPTSEAALPNAPSFEAGTIAPKAGAYSPFVLHLARADGTQEIGKIETTLPEGLLAKLAGVTECSDASIAQAQSRTKIGDGTLERQQPSCPAASEVGIVHVGAGAGPAPYYETGHAYLAGPYKGAPLSLEIVTPAVAGPYDLGAVAVRTALNIDPLTAQVQAVSDPIPHILHGIPLDVRSISIELSRSQFTLNPTSCAKKTITGAAGSVLGATAPLTAPFQVGECKAIAFKPKLKLSLKGSTKHAGHPALKAVLTYPKGGGYANIARAQVNLPHSEFIDQANLNKTCTKPVLLAGNCPASTIYGHAKAWTPLEEAPLEGPVFLVGGFGYKLPALVAELDGQIRVLLAGKIDSGPNKGIRNTFEAVPDAPVERFELNLKGGPKYSLLENSENLCAKPQKAIARFTAQNGLVDNSKVPIQLKCKKHGKAKKKHKGHGRH